MDQEIRNKLRNVVTQCRRLLEESISQDLEGKYTIFAKKDQVTADPNAKMNHLTEEEQAARKDILDHFNHIKARGFKPKEALDQLVREIAFTHLNRLCAYKMMEAREVYVGGQKFREAISRGVNSNGVKFYLAEHPDDERLFNTGHQDVAYRHFLDWLGGTLSDEIGVLFNPNDPANRLYPRQKTLDEVLDLLNGGGIKAEETELREQWPKIWSQDETIGWVYQYFTPKELRDQAREESSAPRNSYELAFRNQFFTPRYVVEFLTDNTLGRIWYEMRKGDTKLKDQCRYMVRRPTEILLNEADQLPKDAAEGRDDLSQEDLLKLPVHIPHRPKKDPRELKILDPACGSGHFLLYCFDLLLTIYEEAFADSDLGPDLRKDGYSTLEDLRRDVPGLILAHNVHGIDIDQRASQIAALALWLRCQRDYQEIGLKNDRPKITRSNFVCAEPMPGEEQLLKEFVGQLEPTFLGQVVEVVFDKMKLAGEAGSLLKIEEEIRDAVSSAKKQWVRETTQATDLRGQPLLFTQAAMDRLAGNPEHPSLFDLTAITDDQFFEQAEGNVVKALRNYAEQAHTGHGFQKRLFTEDAVRGFAFVDLCQKRYDVLLMNPPFGPYPNAIQGYLRASFANSSIDLYSCFIDGGLSRLADYGCLGAITNRTFLGLSSYEAFRSNVLCKGRHLDVLADLGSNVLDSAMVETCAFVVCQSATSSRSTVFIPAYRSDIDKKEYVRDRPEVILRYISDFDALPTAPFAYWVSTSIMQLYKTAKSLEESVLESRAGLQTSDDFRFCRLWWEVPLRHRSWKPFAKGGEFSPFWDDIHLVVNWDDAGREMKTFHREVLGYSESRLIRSEVDYFRPGLNYPWRTSRGFAPRLLPAGCIFAAQGSAILPKRTDENWVETCFLALACLNSQPYQQFMSIGVGAIEGAARSYQVGQVQRLPWPDVLNTPTSERRSLIALGRQEYLRRRSEDLSDETTRSFEGLDLGSDTRASANVEDLSHEADVLVRKLLNLSVVVDEAPSQIVEVGEENAVDLADNEGRQWVGKEVAALSYAVGVLLGRWNVRAMAIQCVPVWLDDPFAALSTCPPGMLQDAKGDPAGEAPDGYPLGINWDGILVEDADHSDDIVRGVQGVLELIWGQQADAIEKEACEILGVNGLRDYFRKPSKGGFWDSHIARYSKSRRKAPIYWLLQSSKKNYAIWLYYHRLDKDLLFKALVNYVEPKIRMETTRVDTLRRQAAAGESGKEAKRLAKDVERREDFLSELRDFEDKLRRAANLHLEPDLNDGVVLNIAPLHELVPWKEAKKYWEELLAGEYEWSSIAKQLRRNGLVN